MLIQDILRESIEIHGRELMAYVVVTAEAYHRAPSYEPQSASLWRELAASNNALMHKVRSKVSVEYTHEDPYATDTDMMHDVMNNKRLKIWTGASDHPVFTPGQNHEFRTIHDYFAHTSKNFADLGRRSRARSEPAKPRTHNFTIRGEMSAYLTHAKLVSPKLIPALFTEIIGQASTFFVTKNFPEQKIAILPGFDYQRLGRVSQPQQQRMQEILAEYADDSKTAIQTSLGALEKDQIDWKLLSTSETS